MAERYFDPPIRVKVKDVALYGIKEYIDTEEKGELVLRNIEQITTVKLVHSGGEEVLGILLSRLDQNEPRFLIITPRTSLFNDYLATRMYSEDVDYAFSFNYENSIQPVLSKSQIISCSTGEKSLHMMPTIRKLFSSPILTPSLPLLQSDSPDYTSSTFYTSPNNHAPNSQKSSIKICFHS